MSYIVYAKHYNTSRLIKQEKNLSIRCKRCKFKRNGLRCKNCRLSPKEKENKILAYVR